MNLRVSVLPVTLLVGVLVFGAHTSQTVEKLAFGPAPAVAQTAPSAAPKAAPKATQPAKAQPASAPQSRMELELRNDMAQRRNTAPDDRLRQIELRERLLEAAEKRVDGKLQELRGIEAQLRQLGAQADKAQDDRFASLVRVYETMKPKDAARIFEKLDMPVQLQVSTRMKPAKMAAMMAEMTPDAARALTMELAQIATRRPGSALAASAAATVNR
jgi:flagellar motility protein MotE (MotC chaperone)